MILTLLVALFCGSIFGSLVALFFTIRSFDHGYAEGLKEGSTTHSAIRSECLKWAYDKGLADRSETINPFGTILADNADLDEIMVIRYDDQLPHRYKRIVD